MYHPNISGVLLFIAPFMILKIKGIDECLHKEGCEEIVGGHGHKRYNKTFFVVNESVTWETAYSRCRTNYQVLNTDNLSVNLLENVEVKTMHTLKLDLKHKYSITDSLLWTSCMVLPTNNSMLYSTATCDFLQSSYLKFLSKVTTVPKTVVGCVALNTSAILSVASEILFIRDCNEQHLYICESVTKLEWSVFENKNLTLKESAPDLTALEVITANSGQCARRFSGDIYCFAAAFTEGDQTSVDKCVVYVRKGTTVHFSSVFYIRESLFEGQIYVKTQPRFQVILLNSLSEGVPPDTLDEGCETYRDVLYTDVSTVSSTVSNDNSLHGGEATTSSACPCTIRQEQSKNTSTLALETQIQNMKILLSIDKKMTSTYLNRLHCARDDRMSAKVIGIVGVMIMVITIIVIVSCDVPYVHRCLKHRT